MGTTDAISCSRRSQQPLRYYLLSLGCELTVRHIVVEYDTEMKVLHTYVFLNMTEG